MGCIFHHFGYPQNSNYVSLILILVKSTKYVKIILGSSCQMFSSLTPPKKAQLRAPLSPLQTAQTGFDPNLYSSGSSSAGPALVEIATARSFILNRGIVTDTMSATPLEPGW